MVVLVRINVDSVSVVVSASGGRTPRPSVVPRRGAPCGPRPPHTDASRRRRRARGCVWAGAASWARLPSVQRLRDRWGIPRVLWHASCGALRAAIKSPRSEPIHCRGCPSHRRRCPGLAADFAHECSLCRDCPHQRTRWQRCPSTHRSQEPSGTPPNTHCEGKHAGAPRHGEPRS